MRPTPDPSCGSDRGVVRAGGVDLREVDPDALAAIRMVPQDGFCSTSASGTTSPTAARAPPPTRSSERSTSSVFVAGSRPCPTDSTRSWANVVDGSRSGSVTRRPARAQVADPGLLVLDEATSAVDLRPRSVGRRPRSPRRRSHDDLIAHRLSTAERADLVIVFDKGRVAQMGPHEELVAVPGIYQTLYESWLGNTRSEHPAG